MQRFITIRTVNQDNSEREVTLAYSTRYNEVVLLGNIPHNTKIIIDQNLVNALQELVDLRADN